jgi:DNA mismatch repair protein MLH1
MLPFSTAQPNTDQNGEGQQAEDGVEFQYGSSGRDPMDVRLSSIKNLRAAVRAAMHNELNETFAAHTYVGLVDERRRIAAVQSGVKLLLVDYGIVLAEFFYQLGLTDFGNFGVINLESSPKLVDLISLAAAVERDEHYQRVRAAKAAAGEDASPKLTEEETEINDMDIKRIADRVAAHLIDRREMLNEYFSISISEDGCLLSIPLLIKGYLPSLAKLPRFLLRLGPYVDWTNEEQCFRTLLRELAAFYTPEQLPPARTTTTAAAPPTPGASSDPAAVASAATQEQPGIGSPSRQQQSPERTDAEDEVITRRRNQLSYMLEHVLFPALRSRLVATGDLVRGVVEVADLKGLYRVFERC